MASHSTNHPFRTPDVPQDLRTRTPNPPGVRYARLQKAGASPAAILIHGFRRANPGSYQMQATRNPAVALPYGSLAEMKS
jgi:hypothetical protein